MSKSEVSKIFSLVKKIFLLGLFLFVSAASCWYAFPGALIRAADKAADIVFISLQWDKPADFPECMKYYDWGSLKFLLSSYFFVGCALAFIPLFLGKLKDLRSYHVVEKLSRILFIYILLISIISMILVWLDITPLRINGYGAVRVGYLLAPLFPLPPGP